MSICVYDTHTPWTFVEVTHLRVAESPFALIPSKDWTQVKLLWQDRCPLKPFHYSHFYFQKLATYMSNQVLSIKLKIWTFMLKPTERHRPLICWPLLQWEAKVIDIRNCTDSDLDNSVRNKAPDSEDHSRRKHTHCFPRASYRFQLPILILCTHSKKGPKVTGYENQSP